MFKNLQEFFEAEIGKAAIVAAVVVLLALLSLMDRGHRDEGGNSRPLDVRALTISALMIAMAMVLSQVRLFKMPQGGSVTAFSMLPIALCAYLFGTKRGIMAGVCLGLINLMFDPYVIHPAQLLIDYILAFGALGIGGLVRYQKNGLIKGYLLGIFGRYICAVASGVIFFGAYAPQRFNAWTWSLWYNLTYIAAEGAITVIVLCIPAVKRLFEKAQKQVEAPDSVS
ncbi:energy-coupled thiamine transporter ThiT [Pseudoramibacter alactolyticus]|uniref:energy-coupled thiamine transporter ThiT n=1 Tax=Pseudoramibacter alactolyticus TaxID=113287 RepID=UPI002356E685|nr:energy-coupled thiamine transporter ThiT [Pseudoramibacter alactolyticus]MBM6968061.1 energy-coupled thiamine transporter ThiT [Pseudoramibacter alactolyticus]